MYIAAGWITATVINILLIGVLSLWGGKFDGVRKWLIRLSLVLMAGTLSLLFAIGLKAFEYHFKFIGMMLFLIAFLLGFLTYLTHIKHHPTIKKRV